MILVRRILNNVLCKRLNLRRRKAWPTHELQLEQLEVRSVLTSLIGAEVTVGNTFESIATGSEETPVGDLERVTVQQTINDPELKQFSGLYDIDIDGGEISMRYNLSESYGSDPARVIEAGTFDRYRFKVEGLAPGDFISSAVADTTRNLVPNVTLADGDTIVVEIGPGMQIGENFDARILVDVDSTPRSLEGTAVTITKTFESALQTSGIEVPDRGPVTATINYAAGFSGAEYPDPGDLNNRYRINVELGTISINWSPGGLVELFPNGPFDVPPDTFKRFYFDFDLGTNDYISSASARTSTALVPNVRIVDEHTIVAEIGPGMQEGGGFNAVIDFDVDTNGPNIIGRKWQDLDNDGVRSSNEGWLNGWDIQLLNQAGDVVDTTRTRNIDLNNDGLIDPTTEMGVYLFEGVQNGTYDVKEVRQPGWVQTAPIGNGDQRAFELDRDLNLVQSSSDFFNWGGRGERWVFGSGNWYFVTPDGAFLQWNGSPRSALSGELIAMLKPAVHQDLSLLYDAPAPGRNFVNVVDGNDGHGPDFGNYLAPPLFRVDVEADPEVANDVLIRWNSTGVVDSRYEIWITDVNTRKRFKVETGLEGNSYTTTLPDRRYRVWMRSEYSPGVFSAWSKSQEFELLRSETTIMPSGLDPGIDATPVIEWTPQAEASSYEVRVTDLSGNREYYAAQITGTSHRIGAPLQLGTHLVSVRANYPDGSRDDWSTGQELVIGGTPIVQLIGNTVSWTPVKAATSYDLWVKCTTDNGTTLEERVVYENNIHDLSFQLPNLPRSTYALWVRAIRAEGGEKYLSDWSQRTDFRVSSNQDAFQLESLSSEIQLVSRDFAQLRVQEEHDRNDVASADEKRSQAVSDAEVNPEQSQDHGANRRAKPDPIAAVMAEFAGSNFLDEIQS